MVFELHLEFEKSFIGNFSLKEVSHSTLSDCRQPSYGCPTSRTQLMYIRGKQRTSNTTKLTPQIKCCLHNQISQEWIFKITMQSHIRLRGQRISKDTSKTPPSFPHHQNTTHFGPSKWTRIGKRGTTLQNLFPCHPTEWHCILKNNSRDENTCINFLC